MSFFILLKHKLQRTEIAIAAMSGAINSRRNAFALKQMQLFYFQKYVNNLKEQDNGRKIDVHIQ